MAAFDTPWMMSSSPVASRNAKDDDGAPAPGNDPNPPTIASFSPVTLSHGTSVNKQRSTILVHQKSPLLIATPPQITRALAYSHPFLLPLNKFVGLLTWTSSDPWESFLLVAGFWGVVLYGDAIMRYAGPVVIVMGLILGMYSRRYSPLSSQSWSGDKQKGHTRLNSEATKIKHQKTLDEIVETLKIFTSRCNVLLDPLLELTDFLSTQRTATSATTRPALTTLLIRILLVTPLWMLLTFRPIQIITTKRIVLVSGTIFLTWHSRPNKVAREILWRSSLVRRLCAAITGLHFTDTLHPLPPTLQTTSSDSSNASEQPKLNTLSPVAAKRRPETPGVRFTFILYENQRRWVGLGWTTSLFAYERAPWTDEHLNPAPIKEEFELPDVEGGLARWRWVKGGQWLVEGAAETEEGGIRAREGADGGQGWIYYDNKWQNGRRGIDGWGRYTRRRKWYRDAELVEVSPSTEVTPTSTHTPPSVSSLSSHHTPTISSNSAASTTITVPPFSLPAPEYMSVGGGGGDGGGDSVSLKGSTKSMATGRDSDGVSVRSGFGVGGKGEMGGTVKRLKGSRGSRSSSFSVRSGRSTKDMEAEDEVLPGLVGGKESDWGIGDDVRMGLE